MDLNGIKILSDGPLPLLAAVYDQLNIGNKVDELVEWDRIPEFYADKGVEKLIGEGVTFAHTNEFCIGRTLDKIYDAGAKKLYSSVALGALDIEKIEVKSIHWDTTSKSFQGQYIIPEKSKEDEGPIEITYGYSKDMRKDLKQMKFGFGVTRDKIPIFADVLSGNIDDKTWNGDVITTFKEWLTFIDPAKVMHIADSALVTKDNLLSINDDTYKFISRPPATFKLEKELRERAVSRPELWNEISRLTDKEEAATYKTQSFLEKLEGKRYRFVVSYSDHLDERKDRSIDKEIDAELRTINEETDEHISKDGYYCEADAKSAAEKFIAQISSKYHLIKYTISQEERDKKRSTRGRPKKSENKETETFYKVDIQLERNQALVDKKKDEAGMFVLISNEAESEKLTDLEVLEVYKKQYSVESTFRILKDPYYVDEIFLKKPERVEAFGCVMVIAVLLLNVIERRIRKSFEGETQGIALQGMRITLTPTGTAILDVFEYVKVLAIPMANSYQRVIPEGLNENQNRILKLCGVPGNIYVSRENTTLVVQA